MRAHLVLAMAALAGLATGAAGETLTADQAFERGNLVGKTVTVRRISCVYLGPSELKDTICEGKGAGGRSAVFMATSAVWDDDAEHEAAIHLERACSGTANLGARQCFFSMTLEVRLIGPVQFLEAGNGTIAAKMITAGPVRLRRAR